MKLMDSLYKRLSTKMVRMSPDTRKLCVDYGKTVFLKTRISSHVNFIRTCLDRNVIPKGFRVRTHWQFSLPSTISNSERLGLSYCKRVMRLKLHEFSSISRRASCTLESQKQQLSSLVDAENLKFVKSSVLKLNAELYTELQSVKSKKLKDLLPDIVPAQPSNQTGKTVVNIPEDLVVDPAIVEILAKGTKFIPTPRQVDKERLTDDLQQFFRRIKLHYHFNNPDATIRSGDHVDVSDDECDSLKQYNAKKKKSNFTPKTTHPAIDSFIEHCTEEFEQMDLCNPRKHNTSSEQEKALRSLLRRDDLVVKPADKGGAVVVMSRDFYVTEAKRQLEDGTFYQKEPGDLTSSNVDLMKEVISDEISKGNLPSSALNMIPDNAKCGRFYLLIKIHKPGNPGRPVVSSCGCPTEQLSAFLDDLFQPINTRLKTYLKDTNHLLEIYNDVPPTLPGQKRLLFKHDVTSLYSVIPHIDGLVAIKFWLLREEDFQHDIDCILRLAELVLTLNHFEFDDEHYTQCRGVAMGTRMGPSYACLFMGWLEERFFSSYTGPIPEVYKRFIDDTTGTTIMPQPDLEKFLDAFGSFHPAIKVVTEISEISLDTLDVIAKVKENGTLATTVFYKPTDSHSYVPYSSHHPKACLDSIPYSQFLRLRRICSEDDDFKEQCSKMAGFFLAREYPRSVVERALVKASRVSRASSLIPKVKNSDHKIPLVLPYYAHLSYKISAMVKKNAKVLGNDPNIGFLFKDKVLTSLKNAPSIKKRVIRSKLRTLNDEIPGNFPCNVRACKTCDLLCPQTVVIGPCGSFDISGSFSCYDTCVIYVITCTKCNVLYVGETGDTLRNRKNGHISDINCKKVDKNEVAEHFCSSPHRIEEDFSIKAIMRVHNQHERRIIEAKLIKKLGTLTPLGMNKEASTFHR